MVYMASQIAIDGLKMDAYRYLTGDMTITRMHIKYHYVRDLNDNIFPRCILESRTTKLPNFEEPICHLSWVWSQLYVIFNIMNLIQTYG
jgi:hypothetical protein